MANLPSAIKAARQAKTRQKRNQQSQSKTRTLSAKLLKAISTKGKKKEELIGLLREVESSLMKAAKRGVIKKKNASRRISRFSKKIASLTA